MVGLSKPESDKIRKNNISLYGCRVPGSLKQIFRIPEKLSDYTLALVTRILQIRDQSAFELFRQERTIRFFTSADNPSSTSE